MDRCGESCWVFFGGFDDFGDVNFHGRDALRGNRESVQKNIRKKFEKHLTGFAIPASSVSTMTNTATVKRLESQIEAIANLAIQLGITKPGESTALEHGSKFYGRAFRLVLMKEGSTEHHRHPLGDYLGMTKPETSDALGHILNTLWACSK